MEFELKEAKHGTKSMQQINSAKKSNQIKYKCPFFRDTVFFLKDNFVKFTTNWNFVKFIFTLIINRIKCMRIWRAV